MAGRNGEGAERRYEVFLSPTTSPTFRAAHERHLYRHPARTRRDRVLPLRAPARGTAAARCPPVTAERDRINKQIDGLITTRDRLDAAIDAASVSAVSCASASVAVDDRSP
jgi:hypothetical protein